MNAHLCPPPQRTRPEACIEVSPGGTDRGRYAIHTVTLQVQASRAPQLIDLTPTVGTAVEASGIRSGQANVFSTHTTAALVLNEDEALLHRDMADFLEALASSGRRYRHDDMSLRTENLEPDHGRNAHAHLKHMLIGSSVTVPVADGRLAVGTWQRLFLLELDRPRTRTVLVQVCGVETV